MPPFKVGDTIQLYDKLYKLYGQGQKEKAVVEKIVVDSTGACQVFFQSPSRYTSLYWYSVEDTFFPLDYCVEPCESCHKRWGCFSE